MSEHIDAPRIADIPEEDAMLTQLTEIEKLLAQNRLDEARQAVQTLKPVLNRYYENREQMTKIFVQIENRLTRIDWQLNPPDARSGDES